MKNITMLPKFMPGQVIDLSYRHKGLPNRLLIMSVFLREQDTEWMYECTVESTGLVTNLNEGFITSNMTNKEAEVYKCKEIINLYNDGWRFCGNLKRSCAHDIASKHATNRYIRNIILRPALAANGSLMNNHYGMWVKYNNTINNDGTVNVTGVADDVITIK